MIKIGILSGSGDLPLSIGKNLIKNGYKVCFFLIENSADHLLYKDYEYIEINIISFSDILSDLHKNNVDQIIMAGNISRPSIKDIKFDFNTLALIKEYFLESKGDDQLLKSISNLFLKKGFPLFNWINICDELFASEIFLTKKKPSLIAYQNVKKGLEIFKLIGNADIGQSIIIQNKLILGIECIEGTDLLINRCRDYKRSGDKGILLKLSKYNQHNELDIPTIGVKTLENLVNNDYEGLFIEKNKCIIMDKDKVINFCNENNIFLSTVNKIER